MDSLKDFFSNCIVVTNNDKNRIKTIDLFTSFSTWLEKNSIKNTYNQRSFNSDVKKLGFEKRESNGKTFFPGLIFKNVSDPVIDPKKVLSPTKKIVPSPTKKIVPPSPKKKLLFHDNFIKFKDFSLHVPSYIAITSKMPDNILYLYEIPLDLYSATKLLRTKNIDLDNSKKAKLYRDKILSFNSLPPDQATLFILVTGLHYSRLLFDRDLLLCNNFDEFYSFCNNNPALIKEATKISLS